MSERTRKFNDRGASKESIGDVEVGESRASHEQRNDHDIDSILDEIDDVLEANAEDFVRNYVQKGGE
jgi:ubiquitin-like protein Pup